MRIALKLLSRFSDYAKKVELEVHLRPDSWYIEHYYIPSVFPFQPPEPMPSELVFRLAPTLDCTKLGTGKVSCLGSNFEP